VAGKVLVMLCLNAYHVVERILKGLKVQAWCLLRFDEGKIFDVGSSALEPQNFLGVVEGLTGFGFNFLGGYTDRGVYKLVNTYDNVKSWLKGERGALGFINLYWTFMHRIEPPSGLLVLTPECLIFLHGVSEPYEEMWFRLVGVPEEERERVDELALKYGLRWWGEPAHPILYRNCKLNLENAKMFWLDTLAFLKEVHHSKI
jgi:hypothetical protein